MLRLREGLICGLPLLIWSCTATPPPAAEPVWETIFDGETLTGWTPKIVGQPAGEDTAQIFRAENGVLSVSYDGYEAFGSAFGHLFYSEDLSDYRLRFDYQFRGVQTEGGPGWAFMNSGVMVHAQAPDTMDVAQAFPVSVEAQLLGTSEQTPGRTTANICTPGTHIVIDDDLITQHCIDSETLAQPAGDWVTFEILVRNSDLMELKIDGAAAFSLNQPQFDTSDRDVERLGLSGLVGHGHFALQAESHPVAFRNIQLMRLEPGTP